jgi:hypothetical protein
MSYPPGRMAGMGQALDDGEVDDGLAGNRALKAVGCAQRDAGSRAVLAGTAGGGGEGDR